jgi:glycosyltransferase involved in cell wall biosynthesis
MKIGYLHLGPSVHGVHRYGRLLAAESKKQADLKTLEVSVLLTEDQTENTQRLLTAATELSAADIVHMQFSKFASDFWGAPDKQLDYIQQFFDHCSAPVVVTLHDVFYTPVGFSAIVELIRSKLFAPTPQLVLQLASDDIGSETADISQSNRSDSNRSTSNRANRSISSLKTKITKGIDFAKRLYQGSFGLDSVVLKELAKRTHSFIVCTQEEAKRLKGRVQAHQIKVIPHFVESRAISITPQAAKQELNLANRTIITLLGFIYPAKGHRIVIEAMPSLPQDVTVVFAGGPSSGHEGYADTLVTIAKAKNVAAQLRITGYLAESELEKYLMATDIAVWPPEVSSASGSLATWISAARPIIACDLPQVKELQQIAPGAIRTFSPYTAETLCASIQSVLQTKDSLSTENAPIQKLKESLSIANIFGQHLQAYRVASGARPDKEHHL